MLTITLPWPPSVNHYWRNVAGRTLISADGRAYRKAVSDHVFTQRAAKRLAGRLEVRIYAAMPDKRSRDLDNLLKSILDSLTHAGVWIDDSQIDVLSIRRGTLGRAYVIVEIEDAV